MKLVIDASALGEILLRSPRGRRLERFVETPDLELCAPHLIDVELLSLVRRRVAKGQIDADRGDCVLALLKAWPITRFPHLPLLDRAWDMRHNFSTYDATYVALAEALDATLITCDARLAAAPGHTARIELVG